MLPRMTCFLGTFQGFSRGDVHKSIAISRKSNSEGIIQPIGWLVGWLVKIVNEENGKSEYLIIEWIDAKGIIGSKPRMLVGQQFFFSACSQPGRIRCYWYMELIGGAKFFSRVANLEVCGDNDIWIGGSLWIPWLKYPWRKNSRNGNR